MSISVNPMSATVTADRRRGIFGLNFGGKLRLRRAADKEIFLLTMICALDMLTTLYWVMMGHATESNALLAWTFDHHPVLFVLVKLASYFPALVLAQRLARNHPLFTKWLLRFIIFAYIGWYVLNVR